MSDYGSSEKNNAQMGSAINLDEIKRFEVTEVYTHPDAKVDIVLVHGLNGDPRRTWTGSNGTFWPTQLLPTSLKSAQARILVYGYNGDVYAFGSGSGKGPSTDMIHQHAQTLLTSTSLERKSEDVPERPIIWVVHSLGGILVKRALELSFDLQAKNADDLRSIYVSTYGIIFLGTPHNGSDIAKFGLILENIVHALVPKKLLESQSQLVKTLKNNNETLQNINLKFLDIYPNRFKVCMVHEGQATDFKGTKSLIVDQASAGPLLPDVQYFGIEATHSGMCKFDSKNSPGYTNVSVTLRSWAQEAPPIVQGYWELERIQRHQILSQQAGSFMNRYNSPPQPQYPSAPSTPDPSSINNSTIIEPNPTHTIAPDDPEQDSPYFIKPNGFRPNSLFVGRKEELALLHKKLFDKERRAEGTSAVLISSLPGGGKSHLARQYVYEHKEAFPGGIFWIRAKSETELVAGFWDIARKAALKDTPEPEGSESMKDSKVWIKMVKKWLNHRHEWLMILDGIHFANVEGLQKFIPDSKNTSLIYTSTERSVSRDHHFMNPQIIKLPPLTAVEAQRLLLLELDRREPFSQDDLKNSMILVQAIEYLPVVIHSVAQRMKTTDEPLSKFARTYSTQRRLRGLDSYTAVVEQLNAIHAEEALNLINIICFFSQHIPVEMISLGLRAINIPVKASEPVTGKSLNNTFKILNTFALIDRNEQDLSISQSHSSKGSRDMLADNVDVIRLHSVVQGFFSDTLASEGKVPIWLDRAVRVFCCSYDRANDRITQKTNAGLVEDYRLYEIHGIKLRDQLRKFVLKSHHREEREVLAEAQEMLEQRLRAISLEIEKRTPESTQELVQGKSEIFLTSIFDRTSSSSDTASDTPGRYEIHSGVSTWGLEPEKGQHESPTNLMDQDYNRRMEATWKINFPYPKEEDTGYDSDREGGGSVAMTIQPSQRTLIQEPLSLLSPSGSWKKGKPRRTRNRIDGLPIHRTVKYQERTRYRDSAGAWRSVQADDPRLNTETVHIQGVLESRSPRDRSRGRISSHSDAVAALAHISKTSPPPARGGGRIQAKRSTSRGHMMTGIPSYARAVAASTSGTPQSYAELSRPEPQSSNESSSTLDLPRNAALEALQRIASVPQQVWQRTPGTPKPPYPTSPCIQPGSESEFFQMPGLFSQENITLGPEPSAPNVCPRKEGLPPIESYTGPETVPRHPAALSDSMPATMYIPRSDASGNNTPPLMSLSSPNINLQREASDGALYYPGRPELSHLMSTDGGYTSQPMSRETSGQSNKSHHSTHSASMVERRRRPSVAETEPNPQLPMFSPRIPLTSYQDYKRMRERERDILREMRAADLETLRRESEVGVANSRRSPNLEYARAALIDRQGSGSPAGLSAPENPSIPPLKRTQSPRQKFNPKAPAFSPANSFNPSPRPPSVPANSMFSISNPSTMFNSAATSAYPSPLPYQSFASPPPLPPHPSPAAIIPSPASFNSTLTYPPPQPPRNSPLSFTSVHTPNSDQMASGSGTGMERSSSGGVRVGRKFIEFGDYPELVDYELARERVVRSRGEREREAERRRAASAAVGDQVPRTEDSGEIFGLGLGIDMSRRN